MWIYIVTPIVLLNLYTTWKVWTRPTGRMIIRRQATVAIWLLPVIASVGYLLLDRPYKPTNSTRSGEGGDTTWSHGGGGDLGGGGDCGGGGGGCD